MNGKIISLQISDELYSLIRMDAEKDYMNLSAYIRKLLIQIYKEKLNGQKEQN